MIAALAVLFPFLFGLLISAGVCVWAWRQLSQPVVMAGFIGGVLRGMHMGGKAGVTVVSSEGTVVFVPMIHLASAIECQLSVEGPIDPPSLWPPSAGAAS